MATTLGFQLYTLQQFGEGWAPAFEAVKEMGIDTIEVWCGAVPGDNDGSIPLDELRAPLMECGMKLACGHLGSSDYDANYEAWRDLLLELGSKDWIIPFEDGETLDDWLGLLPKYREMAARMKEDGLALGYHNHHMELVKLGDKYVMEHLLDNMPELNAQFHIGQFKAERGISLPDWIKKYEGRVSSLHVNDSGAGEGAVRLGEGTCKAEESIKTALDTGVEIFIMEIMLTQDDLDGVKRDVEFTRKLIG